MHGYDSFVTFQSSESSVCFLKASQLEFWNCTPKNRSWPLILHLSSITMLSPLTDSAVSIDPEVIEAMSQLRICTVLCTSSNGLLLCISLCICIQVFTFFLFFLCCTLTVSRFLILDHKQLVGLHGRVIDPSQGHYLNTGQHKHRINVHTYQTSMA
jgi:hypothetical protein